MPDSSYVQILHVFCREFRQDCFVNTVLAEGGLVLFKARLGSQLATSMTAPKLSFEVHHRPGERPCPGHRAAKAA